MTSPAPLLYTVLFVINKDGQDQTAFYFARAHTAEAAIAVAVEEAKKQHAEGAFIPVCALSEQEVASIQQVFQQIAQHEG